MQNQHDFASKEASKQRTLDDGHHIWRTHHWETSCTTSLGRERTLLRFRPSNSALQDIHCPCCLPDPDLIWTLGNQVLYPPIFLCDVTDCFSVIVIVTRLVWSWFESALTEAEWIAWSPVLTHCYSSVSASIICRTEAWVRWPEQGWGLTYRQD